jgi:hypothetical protein
MPELCTAHCMHIYIQSQSSSHCELPRLPFSLPCCLRWRRWLAWQASIQQGQARQLNDFCRRGKAVHQQHVFILHLESPSTATNASTCTRHMPAMCSALHTAHRLLS